MSSPNKPVRALLVEDDEVDAEKVRRCLRRQPGLVGEVQEARRLSEALAQLRDSEFDLVLLDLTLPDSQGLATVVRVVQAAPRAAVVVMTGLSDQQTALEALTLGASDFLVKGEFDDRLLLRSLSYALERRRIRQRLQQSEANFRLLATHSGDLITRHHPDGSIAFASDASRSVLGLEPEELVGKSMLELVDEEHREQVRSELRALQTEETVRFEFQGQCARGERAWMETTGQRVDSGELVLVTRNVQERKQAEERLRDREQQLMRARQLEAVGRLAGGVAHDFNNLLTVISGYAGMVLEDLETEHPLRPEIREILEASQRGARLVSQLLAVARQQVVRPQSIDLGDVLRRTARLLRTAVGEQIRLTVEVAPETPPVLFDPLQLEQVLLNLAFNSRDAMPRGGELTLSACVSPEGRGVLSVSDTGCGIEPEVLAHLFEPFFTTKGEAGTGLGLATVYGIVQQAGGSIEVESQPGHGTTFRIVLPKAEPGDQPAARPSEPPGSGTILVVEDNEAVRRVTTAVLERAGFRVVAAASGPEALEVAEGQALDLVVSDVVMPKMSGIKVVEQLRQERPQLRVLLTSGYNEDPEVAAALAQGELDFLPKPFTPQELVAAVRRVLELA